MGLRAAAHGGVSPPALLPARRTTLRGDEPARPLDRDPQHEPHIAPFPRRTSQRHRARATPRPDSDGEACRPDRCRPRLGSQRHSTLAALLSEEPYTLCPGCGKRVEPKGADVVYAVEIKRIDRMGGFDYVEGMGAFFHESC